MFDNMGNSTPVNTGKTNEPQLTRKAVLFARVSTARQEKEGLSLDEIQLPRMRDYAIEQNLKSYENTPLARLAAATRSVNVSTR